MLRSTVVLLRRVALAPSRAAAPLARELRRRCAATAGAPPPAPRRFATAKSEALSGGARASASRLAAVAAADAPQHDAPDADVDAAAAELAAQDDGEEEEEEEGDDGEDENIWPVFTPRGRKELVVQGGVMMEPNVAERLKCGTNAKITSSEYVSSAVSLQGCPPPKYPEFAFIGRSNVGKSSLINLLTSRKALAMVSKTPGTPSAQPPHRARLP